MPLAIGEITIINLNDVNISTTPPLDPVEDQLWLDTGVVPNVLRRWAWIEDEEGWGWINASPTSPEDIGAETPDGAQEKADDAVAAASTLLQSMADGTYTGGTFIDGKSIISPTVVGLQGTFGELMAGNPFGARLEMGESAGEPFLTFYDANEKRLSILKDKIEFHKDSSLAGYLEAVYTEAKDEYGAPFDNLNIAVNSRAFT